MKTGILSSCFSFLFNFYPALAENDDVKKFIDGSEKLRNVVCVCAEKMLVQKGKKEK